MIRRALRTAIPWVVLCLAVCVQTYPLVLNVSSGIYGYAGDSLSAIINFSQLSKSICSPADWHVLRYARPVVDAAGAVLTILVGPVVAYNALLLSGYVLTAVTTYFLTLHLARDRQAALLGAFVFTFCPYRLVHSYGHLHLSLTQWLPLYILCFVRLRERPRAWRAVQLGIVLLLVSLSSFYYGYFAALLFLPLTVMLLCRPAAGPWRFSLYSLLSLAPSLAGATLLFRNRVEGVFHGEVPTEKLINDLFTYSARPLEYLIPHASSLWRHIVLPFWRHNLHGSNEVEQALFLGLVPVGLAVIGVVAAVRRRTPAWPVALGITILFVAIALSAPPAFTVGGVQIPGPSLVLARLFPAFRVYARMGVMAYLGLALLAALGWKSLAEHRTESVRWPLWSVSVLLILLEYTNVPPFRFLSLKPPPVYEWLRSMDGHFAIVEFPLPPEPRHLASRRFYFSLYHGKRSRTHLRGVDLDQVQVVDQTVVQEMADEGVRYVILHEEPPDLPREIVIDDSPPDSVPRSPKLAPDNGMKLVHRVGGTLVYELVGERPSL
jgi:hypothetical protein